MKGSDVRTREEAMFRYSRRSPTVGAAFLAGVAAFVLLTASARAEGPVAVRVQVIAATSKAGEAPGSDVDARLEGLRNRLNDFAFSSYKLLEEKRLDLVLESSQ